MSSKKGQKYKKKVRITEEQPQQVLIDATRINGCDLARTLKNVVEETTCPAIAEMCEPMFADVYALHTLVGVLKRELREKRLALEAAQAENAKMAGDLEHCKDLNARLATSVRTMQLEGIAILERATHWQRDNRFLRATVRTVIEKLSVGFNEGSLTLEQKSMLQVLRDAYGEEDKPT